MRRTQLLQLSPFQGFQRFDQNLSPMHKYSPNRWSYEFSQVMTPPTLVNRALNAPFKNHYANVNRYRKGVWVDVDMHPSMRVALEPYLSKLQLTRTIPNTDPKEAAEDYKKVSPLVGDDHAKMNWLAKVIQLCGHKKAGDIALELWNKECVERYMKGPAISSAVVSAALASSSSSAGASSSDALIGSSSASTSTAAALQQEQQLVALAATVPSIGLIEAILYATSASDKPDWKPIFERCLKNGWNLTPKFSTRLWVCLLTTAGNQNDAKGARMLLEEMLDVQASIETIEGFAYVRALNSFTDKGDYNYGKKFLFNLSPETIERVLKCYKTFRGYGAETIQPPLPDNEKMFYHVAWHNSIRQPQRFSPRQLYFNYKPNYAAGNDDSSGKSGGDVLKERIAKWKEEGLLPEDYEFEGDFVDKTARFKQTMRHEHWSKLPKVLKNPKYGYCGEH